MMIATLLVFSGSSSVAAEEKVIKWKLAMTWPAGLPPFAWTVTRFADNVEAMSGGRMTIRVDDKNKHNELDQNKNDSIKKNTLVKIISNFYNKGITDSLMKYSKICEKLSKNLNDSLLMGSSINFQAVSYMNMGNWNSALKKLKEALTIFENLKNENQIKLCMYNIATVYSSTGKNKEAIKIYLKKIIIQMAI